MDLQACYRHVTGMLQACYRHLQACYKHVTGMLQAHYRYNTGMLQALTGIGVWKEIAMDCIQNLFPRKIFDVKKNGKAVSKNTLLTNIVTNLTTI
jgi:hypothetical protein